VAAIQTASTIRDKLFFCPVPQIVSFRLMLLGVLAVILTLRHLNLLVIISQKLLDARPAYVEQGKAKQIV